MSRTDNTRPWNLQWMDRKNPGYIQHCCKGFCDYKPENNLIDFFASKSNGTAVWRLTSCSRVTYKYGGKNYFGGAAKGSRKILRRRIRARDRQALHRALYSEDYEYDLLPIREDARTLLYDLT